MPCHQPQCNSIGNSFHCHFHSNGDRRLLSRCLCLPLSLALSVSAASSRKLLRIKMEIASFSLGSVSPSLRRRRCCRSPCCRRRFCFTFVCLIAGFYNRIYHAGSACCLCLCLLPHIRSTLESFIFIGKGDLWSLGYPVSCCNHAPTTTYRGRRNDKAICIEYFTSNTFFSISFSSLLRHILRFMSGRL